MSASSDVRVNVSLSSSAAEQQHASSSSQVPRRASQFSSATSHSGGGGGGGGFVANTAPSSRFASLSKGGEAGGGGGKAGRRWAILRLVCRTLVFACAFAATCTAGAYGPTRLGVPPAIDYLVAAAAVVAFAYGVAVIGELSMAHYETEYGDERGLNYALAVRGPHISIWAAHISFVLMFSAACAAGAVATNAYAELACSWDACNRALAGSVLAAGSAIACIGCIAFSRFELKQRKLADQRMRHRAMRKQQQHDDENDHHEYADDEIVVSAIDDSPSPPPPVPEKKKPTSRSQFHAQVEELQNRVKAESDVRVRVMSFVFSLLAFALAAGDTSFQNFGALQYLVLAGVVSCAWNIVCLFGGLLECLAVRRRRKSMAEEAAHITTKKTVPPPPPPPPSPPPAREADDAGADVVDRKISTASTANATAATSPSSPRAARTSGGGPRSRLKRAFAHIRMYGDGILFAILFSAFAAAAGISTLPCPTISALLSKGCTLPRVAVAFAFLAAMAQAGVATISRFNTKQRMEE